MDDTWLGFPEFTRFFNLPHGRKLQLGMDFTMTVGADKLTLSKLLSNSTPTPSIAFVGYTEIFIERFEMMNL